MLSLRELLDARRDLLRTVETLELDQVRGKAGDVRGGCASQLQAVIRGEEGREGTHPLICPRSVVGGKTGRVYIL